MPGFARTTATLAAFALAVSLSACSTPTPTGPTLAETKSPVQLLRNEATTRLAADAIGDFQVGDTSVACKTVDEDPKGILRQWQSTATFDVADDAVEAAKALAGTFVDDGWQVRVSSDTDDAYRSVLSKTGSIASIHVDASGEQLEIWTNGPCVETAGADSSEVSTLSVEPEDADSP